MARKRRPIKLPVPPILQVRGPHPMSQEELVNFRRMWEQHVESGRACIISSTPDLDIKFIHPISPKRARYINFNTKHK